MSYSTKTGLYTGFIYCITNTVNGKQYIGQTSKTVIARFNEHIWDAMNRTDSKMALHRAIRKYGRGSFTIEEVTHISSSNKKELKRLLNDLEINYIQAFKTMIPNGYNICRGGNVRQEDVEKPVYCFTKDGELIARYPSIAEAERCTGVSHGKISVVARCKDASRQSAGGYLWSFQNVAPIYTADRGTGKRRQIEMFSLDGTFIRVFDSAASAADALNLQSSLITACCTGRRKSTGGYRWNYYL